MKVNLELDLILTGDALGVQPEQDTPVQELQIRNGGETLEDLTLQIGSSGDALLPLTVNLERLESQAHCCIPLAETLLVNREYLQRLCHPLTTEVVVTVLQQDNMIACAAKQITLYGVGGGEMIHEK